MNRRDNELIEDSYVLLENELIKKWSNVTYLSEVINKPGRGYVPLTLAVCKGYSGLFDFLIKNGAKVNLIDPTGDTALSDAAQYGDKNVIDKLLDHGADIKINAYQPIRNAIEFHHFNIVRYLYTKCNYINIGNVNKLILYTINNKYFVAEKYRPVIRFFHIEQIRIVVTIFHELPQYIILWITDWLEGSEYLFEYEKVEFIERMQCCIRKVKN